MAEKTAVNQSTKQEVKEPKKYKVIMYNDDMTAMEFVVEVLVDIFHFPTPAAQQTMMAVHRGGKAVVGCYSLDIATTRVNLAMSRAEEYGYPFRMTVEGEND